MKHRRHAYRQARDTQKAALVKAKERMEAITNGLEHVLSMDLSAPRLKEVPAPISVAGNIAAWKKSPSDWQALMTDLEREMRVTITRCEAFIAATETVPVAIYNLVRNEKLVNRSQCR
jgi:hypothetical protein